MKPTRILFVLWAALALLVPMAALAQEGDPATLALMRQMNGQLQALGIKNIAVEQIEFFTIGQGRPLNRLHQTGSRWVAGDPRRLADGDNITYLVDQSDGATTSGLTSAQTEAAIDRALATWNNQEDCLRQVDIVKRPDPGADPDIIDFLFGVGGLGFPFYADIVDAGWYPRALFDAIGGPGGGDGILAFSVSFVFTDDDGNPTDVNGDNFLDVSLNEVYYNDHFGTPGGIRSGNPWVIDSGFPGIDVETIALHENGHSLDLRHFGPPPVAVMNPVYAGIKHEPLPVDHAGMCTVWSSWPR